VIVFPYSGLDIAICESSSPCSDRGQYILSLK